MILQITADPVFEEAFDWLCERRKNYHHNDDVWHLRFHWQRMRVRIQRELREGRYRFAPVRRVRIGRKAYGIWAARDALVLKCLAIVLAKEFEPRLSPCCYHLAGRGGAKGAVRAVMAEAGQATFVFRSDVKSY